MDVARRKKFDPNEFGRKLQELEAITGSQKKAAEKLGVNVSTYRAYKTGKAAPSRERIEKANRVYGQNKRKLQDREVAERLQRQERAREKKRAAREIQKRREAVKLEAVTSWSRKNFDEAFIHDRLSRVSAFIATVSGGSSGQFTDGMDFIGKPRGQKYVTVYGLYTLSYIVEAGDADESNSDLSPTKIPILIDLDKEWDLQTTLDYLESKFMDTAYQHGRRRFIPTRFIGYEL